MLRWIALIAMGLILLVLFVRAGFVVFGITYATWVGFREGGYPGWAQVLAVATVVGTIGYGLYRSITDARNK